MLLRTRDEHSELMGGKKKFVLYFVGQLLRVARKLLKNYTAKLYDPNTSCTSKWLFKAVVLNELAWQKLVTYNLRSSCAHELVCPNIGSNFN